MCCNIIKLLLFVTVVDRRRNGRQDKLKVRKMSDVQEGEVEEGVQVQASGSETEKEQKGEREANAGVLLTDTKERGRSQSVSSGGKESWRNPFQKGGSV